MDRINHNAFCYALFSMDVVNSWTKVVIVVASTVSESKKIDFIDFYERKYINNC